MPGSQPTPTPSILRPLLVIALAALLSAVPERASAQSWSGYGRDPQHSGQAVVGSQIPQKIRWSAAVDLAPPYSGNGNLYIHYGSPVITRVNSVIFPVKTTAVGNFRVEAHKGTDGTVTWSQTTDYTFPAHSWVPVFGMTLTPKDRYLAYPGAGGTIFVRTFPDSASGVTTRYAFYDTAGAGLYASNPAAFNNAIKICTPISSDNLGNLYFGFVSNGAPLPGYPNGIPGGLARISNTGVGSFVSAASMAGDANMTKVLYNCAPAFSSDSSTVYVAVNNSSSVGYLCALNSVNLTTKKSVFLLDPRSTPTSAKAAWVADDSSGTPSIGPDGDVFFGVLESSFPSNNARGFLLHFDASLTTAKLPSAFGWDDTAAIVPSSAVPGYSGASSYLLLTKYNNYASVGSGNGINNLALVDPSTSMVDPVSKVTVMQPALLVAGVTPDSEFQAQYPGAVREWCINSAAIDVVNKCAIVNSEDGHVYRWDFATNQLSPGLMLEPPTGEAYTPTVIGPDGAAYAINNATLFCCIAAPAPSKIRIAPLAP